MGWSQFEDTVMYEFVEDFMSSDTRRKYHNFEHIHTLYKHAWDLNIPYDVNLDVAILWHDFIYDEAPNKELRSISAFQNYRYINNYNYSLDISKISELIHSTINHKYCDDNRLILLDLYDLTISHATTKNYQNILLESQLLYDISEDQAMMGSYNFMSEFYRMMGYNALKEKDDKQQWYNIMNGIALTLDLST